MTPSQELFALFDEDKGIRHNTVLTYIILGVWSLSILQFTLTFASAHRPRRSRGLRLAPERPPHDPPHHPPDLRRRGVDPGAPQDPRLSQNSSHSLSVESGGGSSQEQQRVHRRSVLRVELFATVLSMFMQDGPFLGVRLYTMIKFSVVTYSLVFFTTKNVIVLLLLFYKICLLLGKLCCPKKPTADDEGDVEKHEAAAFYSQDYQMEIVADDDDSSMKKKKKRKFPPPNHKGENNGRPLDNDVDAGDFRKCREGQDEDGFPDPPEAGDSSRRKKKNAKKTKTTTTTTSREGDKDKDKVRGRGKGGSGGRVEPGGLAGELGELQKVIDGPATPAKSMEKTKKYDKYMVSNDATADAKEGDAADDADDAADDADDADEGANGPEPREAAQDFDQVPEDRGARQPGPLSPRSYWPQHDEGPGPRYQHGYGRQDPHPRGLGRGSPENARGRVGRGGWVEDEGEEEGEEGEEDEGGAGWGDGAGTELRRGNKAARGAREDSDHFVSVINIHL